MQITTQDRFFDTIVDTNKLFVSMKTSFKIRTYKTKPDKGYVYLVATGNKERIKINLDLEIPIDKWDFKKERLRAEDRTLEDMNLIIDSFQTKVYDIKLTYRMSEKVLTPSAFAYELKNGLTRIDFIAYFKYCLTNSRASIKKGTYRRYESVLNKLEQFSPTIYFKDIDLDFFERYKIWLTENMNNKKTTINSNIAAIKKHLGVAKKSGIKLMFDLDDLKVGTTLGHREFLNKDEIIKINDLFFKLRKGNQKTITGYFLFSCMTGLRIGDLMDLEPKDVESGNIQFINEKSDRKQTITMNQHCFKLLDECSELFSKKFSHEYMNRVLKIIAVRAGVEKEISFHVARHTFATNFLILGGKVENLQKILNHRSITTTMQYVHILATEANKEMYLMDKLF